MTILRGRTEGQAQILTAAVISTVMLTAALYSLDYSRQTRKTEILAGRRTEMRSALEGAIRQVSYLYRTESGCDPVSLDTKLARIKTDGTIDVLSTPPVPANYHNRQLTESVNGNNYTVALGPVTRLAWNADGAVNSMTGNNNDPTVTSNAGTLSYNAGTSQDAVIEVWTSFGNQRVVQYAALINDCTLPCSCDPTVDVNGNPVDATCSTGVATSGQCSIKADSAISYHRIVDPGTFPSARSNIPLYGQWNRSCHTPSPRKLGDVKIVNPANPASPCAAPWPAAAGTFDLRDVVILKNYLRSGDWAGSCTTLISESAPGANDSCVDFDRDGRVTEIDLNLMEKVLRGYLYWFPVHY